MKTTIVAALIAIILSACGGGGGEDGGAVMKPNATAGGQIVLRPCETTGPGAPPCPATKQ
jgi:hypothetical protein